MIKSFSLWTISVEIFTPIALIGLILTGSNVAKAELKCNQTKKTYNVIIFDSGVFGPKGRAGWVKIKIGDDGSSLIYNAANPAYFWQREETWGVDLKSREVFYTSSESEKRHSSLQKDPQMQLKMANTLKGLLNSAKDYATTSRFSQQEEDPKVLDCGMSILDEEINQIRSIYHLMN